MCTVWTGSGLPLYTVSADSAVRHVFSKSGCLLRTVPANALRNRSAVCDLSVDSAVRNLCAKPSCLLRAVSAYAVCNRLAVFDLSADVTVRDLCTESCRVLCSVSTSIKPAMRYLSTL